MRENNNGGKDWCVWSECRIDERGENDKCYWLEQEPCTSVRYSGIGFERFIVSVWDTKEDALSAMQNEQWEDNWRGA